MTATTACDETTVPPMARRRAMMAVQSLVRADAALAEARAALHRAEHDLAGVPGDLIGREDIEREIRRMAWLLDSDVRLEPPGDPLAVCAGAGWDIASLVLRVGELACAAGGE